MNTQTTINSPTSVGPDFMGEVWAHLLCKIGAHNRSLLCGMFDQHVFTIATACSGTEAPILTLAGLKPGMAKFGVGENIAFEQVFACESDRNKQPWILALHPSLTLLFNDICDLGNAQAHCVINDCLKDIPQAMLLVAGFSCKSVSMLNMVKHLFKGAILDQTGETGITFAGLIAYILTHGPLMVLLENVVGLKGANLKECVEILRRANYFVHVEEVQSLDFYLPAFRARMWFLCIRQELVDASGLSNDYVHDIMATMMTLLRSGNVLMGMDEVRLPETDVHVQDSLYNAGLVETLLEDRFDTDHSKWVDKHKDRVGMEEWSNHSLHIMEADLQPSFPGYNLLTMRQVDMLQCHGVTSLPESDCRVCNINYTDKFASITHNITSTITPRGRYFFTDRVRSGSFCLFCESWKPIQERCHNISF